MSTATTTNEKLIAEMPVDGYPSHHIAAIFPMLDGESSKEFEHDVKGYGLREEIVLAGDDAHDGRLAVLDGRNRQRACLKTDTMVRFRLFGSHESDGDSLAGFVASNNLRRRQLSPSQAAMAAADMLPFFEAEAKSNQRAAGGIEPSAEAVEQAGEADSDGKETIVDTSGEFSQVQTKAKTSKGGASAMAGAAFGASETSVKKAKKLKQEDPEAAEAVRAGKRSLNAAATGKPTAGSLAGQRYNEALERIEKVCGAQQAKGIKEGAILRNRNDVIAYAKEPDVKMLAIRALIDQGWSLKKAINYKAEEILPTHRVVDLADRASAAGGHYEQLVAIINRGIAVKLTIDVKPLADAPRKPAKAKKAIKRKVWPSASERKRKKK